MRQYFFTASQDRSLKLKDQETVAAILELLKSQCCRLLATVLVEVLQPLTSSVVKMEKATEPLFYKTVDVLWTTLHRLATFIVRPEVLEEVDSEPFAVRKLLKLRDAVQDRRALLLVNEVVTDLSASMLRTPGLVHALEQERMTMVRVGIISSEEASDRGRTVANMMQQMIQKTVQQVIVYACTRYTQQLDPTTPFHRTCASALPT